MMEDGFKTLITLANAPEIKLYERDVTPPGINQGGPIDLTNMRNTAWRTNAPRQLKTLEQVTATVAYPSDALSDVKAQIGSNQLITVTYPDGGEFKFWGWLENFDPATHTEGEQPTATATFQPSNRNADGVETAPDYTAASA